MPSFVRARVPVLVRGWADHWPAAAPPEEGGWDAAFFGSDPRLATLKVSVDDGTGARRVLPLGRYIDAIDAFDTPLPRDAAGRPAAAAATHKCVSTRNRSMIPVIHCLVIR